MSFSYLLHDWKSVLRADILISRTVRHVLRVHDARSALFPGDGVQFARTFKFTDNIALVGE